MIKSVNIDNNDLIEELQVIYNEFINQKLELKKEYVSNPYLKIFVFIDNDKIIGFIEISDVIDRYEINNVYVLENYRHNGIASMLMEKVIESGKESNIENITLEVNKNNIQAIGLYKKYDFKECAIRKGYYNGVDGILMKKEMI